MYSFTPRTLQPYTLCKYLQPVDLRYNQCKEREIECVTFKFSSPTPFLKARVIIIVFQSLEQLHVMPSSSKFINVNPIKHPLFKPFVGYESAKCSTGIFPCMYRLSPVALYTLCTVNVTTN